MTPPRWMADAMLGRLARCLRVLGHDTAYAGELPDEEIARRSVAQGRTLLTRDRALARQVPGSVWLANESVDAQLSHLRAQFPDAGWTPRFDRCTVCNAELVVAQGFVPGLAGSELPPAVREGREPLYRCPDCGHRYWEGSHTQRMREHFGQLFSGVPSP